MANGRLIVRRKSYNRKAYTRSDGTRVKAAHVPSSTFKIKDRGEKGRGPKKIPSLRKGTLGKGYFEKSVDERHAILKSKGRQIGERSLGGKLRAIQVLNKNTNPNLSRKAASDAKWVFSHFKGKTYMKKR